MWTSTRITTVITVEPRPNRQLNIKADDALVAAVDRIAVQHQTTRSAIARAFIRQGVQALAQQEG